MKFSLSTVFATVVRREPQEVKDRLEAQADALKESKCIKPLVGQWIDANDVEYLKSVLDLGDDDFARRFPSVADVDHHRRQQMKAAIEAHLDHCPHCALKHGYELELDARIMRACRENRAELMQLLAEEDSDLSEGEHWAAEKWTSHSEPQPETQPEPEIIIDPLAEPA